MAVKIPALTTSKSLGIWSKFRKAGWLKKWKEILDLDIY